MTDEEIKAMELGRELDSIVHKEVMGLTTGIIPEYSKDMGEAWMVLRNSCKRRFSFRNQFFRELEALERFNPTIGVGARNELIHLKWPDAMMFMMPEDICKAALLTIECEKEGGC